MILGISLDENYVYVSTDRDNEVVPYPFAIGRNLLTNTWFVGEEAKNENVDNEDIVIDKLFYIMGNDGTARIGEISYDAKELTRLFFVNLLIKYENIEYVSVVIRQGNVKYLEKIKYALSSILKDDTKYKVTTYSEAFVSYIKRQDKSFYNHYVSLFDFTEKALTYYELVRYIDDNNTEYWKIDTEEHLALPLDLLSGEAGKKVCDNLLYDFAKRCIKQEVYSNIVLSGLGFEDSSSYREFMTFVCSIANVKTDVHFFSRSAVMLSQDIVNNNFDKNVILITDARTTVGIRLNATFNHANTKIELIRPGVEWFDIKDNSFDIIISDERTIKFEILKVIEREATEAAIELPKNVKLRKDKTNLFEIKLMFSQQNILNVILIDKGFGEFYKSTVENTSIPVYL